MDIFAKRIRELREENRYSQYEIADKLGISQSYYARFEAGKGEPNLKTLVLIADLYSVNLDYLLGREEKHAAGVHREQFEMIVASIKKLEKELGYIKENKID